MNDSSGPLAALGRIRSLVAVDLRAAWKRPLYWVLAAILVLLAWGFVVGNVKIGAGSADVGGAKAWINSEFNIAFVDSVILALLLPFFAAIAAGLPMLVDRDRKVDRLLHSTPLSMREYVAARLLGSIVPLGAVLAIFVAAQILFFQFWPMDNAAEVRGPFAAMNFIRPAILFGLPQLLFVAAGSAWLGVRSRQPVLVFVLPVALLLANVFFLWSWSPSWLSPGVNKLLMGLDSAGFRWLAETYLKADRGVAFYNETPVQYDAIFLGSRAAFVALGLLAGHACVWALNRRTGPRRAATAPAAAARRTARGEQAAIALATQQGSGTTLPVMATSPVGFLASTWSFLRVEARQLLRSPGVWLFGPLILLQTFGAALAAFGAFDTPLLHTSGGLAANSFNTLTLLLVLLSLFYTVESLVREERVGAARLIWSTAAPTASIVVGKVLANVLVAAAILACALVACLGVQAWQMLVWKRSVPVELWTYARVWSLLVPTLLCWSAFVALLFSLVRNRYAVYGLGLGTLILTGWLQQRDWLNWASNWHLWSVVQWSDLDRMEWISAPLFWNRLLVLALAALFLTLAIRLAPRRAVDPARLLDPIRPRAVALGLLRFAPLLALCVVAGGYAYLQVQDGFQGSSREKLAKDYWKRNSATWEREPLPALDRIEARVELDPARRGLTVQGEYVLRNPRDERLAVIPLTQGLSWEDLLWTLNGEPIEPTKNPSQTTPPRLEDRSGLWVFTLGQALARDETVRVGFSFHAEFPQGWSRNGGGVSEFVLPSGVVLTSFSPSFLPVVGFVDGVGIDEKNRRDAREYPDDLWRGQVDPALGPAWATDATITIVGPADWTLNCVGVPGEATIQSRSEGDTKSVTWTTDHPVRFLNIVGGPLEEARGETASVFHSSRHGWNVADMASTLDAARKYYGEWFHPYPWRDLKLTEFPGLAGYAQGFPGNISFSESIGFLTRPTEEADAVFMVTAHESAHQWWGNILMPGKGPGGNVLSEGMAHFSTAMLFEQVRGDVQRQAFMKQIEESYVNGRVADSERGLNKIDGSRPGDGPATYDKGGWVFWMTMKFLGRERTLAGLQGFIQRFKDGPDFPLIEDFVAKMREHAEDPVAFDAFARQWYFEVVLPEFKVESATKTDLGDGRWRVEGEVANVGTGRVRVAIGVSADDADDSKASAAATATLPSTIVELGAGERAPFMLEVDFEPRRVVVDPEVNVLQVRRKLAKRAL